MPRWNHGVSDYVIVKGARYIPACLDFDPPGAVMAGHLLGRPRLYAYRPLKRRWPGRHKRAPGHDGNERASVIAAWYDTSLP